MIQTRTLPGENNLSTEEHSGQKSNRVMIFCWDCLKEVDCAVTVGLLFFSSTGEDQVIDLTLSGTF